MAKKYKKLVIVEDMYRNEIYVVADGRERVKTYSKRSQYENAKRFAFANADEVYGRAIGGGEPNEIRLSEGSVKPRKSNPRISPRGVFPLKR